MSILSRIRAFGRNLFRRADVERDLHDELGAYVDGVAAEQRRRGVPAAAAARAARIASGDVEQLKDDVRDVRASERFDRIRRDVVFGARTLRKTPGFTIAAVLALSLGIGATTAMLSVVNGVLLRPLPYADPNRLVVLMLKGRNPVSPATFVDWRHQTRSFTDVAAAEYWTPNLIGIDQPEQIYGLHMSADMFPLLGATAFLGRVFTPVEDAGSEHVAVISYGLWQRRFGADRSVIGREVMLDGARTAIVGVMPRTFQFAPFWATRTELWAPLSLGARAAERGGGSLRLFARLKPGITLEQARTDLSSLSARLEQQFPGTNREPTVEPLASKVVGSVQTPLLVLLLAVTFVLLIACANVAHMLLARAASRQKELGIRTALGATRGRLVGQLLIESLLLAVAGGAGGLLLAVWGVRALVGASPESIPRVGTVSVDQRVLLMTIALTMITAIVFGLVPALRAAQVDLAETFKDGDRASSDGRGRARLRGVLVASEFALALVLLVGAGLMIRTFNALRHIDPGFDPRGLITMNVSLMGTSKADSSVRSATYLDALERIRALPGVESASWINHLPIAGDEWGFGFQIEGRPKPAPGEMPSAAYRVVFPGYFRAMRIPILQGRDLTAADRADAPAVVVINEFMAKQHWPGESPLGKRITVNRVLTTIVGISKNDVREHWAAPPEEEMFLAFEQQPDYVKNPSGHFAYLGLVARAACPPNGRCDPSAIATPIVAAIRAIDRSISISKIESMDALVAESTAESRLYLVLLAGFAAIAVVMASVGIYGVMSYSVARRTHEIGIRIALGAEPAGVLRMIVRQGMALAVAGAAAGVVLALALTRLMGGLLYGVAPRDPMTFVAVVATLSAVAFMASYVPARRATRIDALSALRSD